MCLQVFNDMLNVHISLLPCKLQHLAPVNFCPELQQIAWEYRYKRLIKLDMIDNFLHWGRWDVSVCLACWAYIWNHPASLQSSDPTHPETSSFAPSCGAGKHQERLLPHSRNRTSFGYGSYSSYIILIYFVGQTMGLLFAYPPESVFCLMHFISSI